VTDAFGEAAVVPTRFRVLLVDAHDLVHYGFRALISCESWVEQLAAARSSAAAIELVRRCPPHIAVVDTNLGAESAMDLCEEIRRISAPTRILLMTAKRISEAQARAVGAAGVVPKAWEASDILRAARWVALGKNLYLPESSQRLELLTPRERAVLQMLAQGATNREIGAELSLSEHTIKDHLSSVYRKLHARNRADAVVRAQNLGVLD
jgi:DNA-binding NarL/FixJ family response regulator